MTLCSSFEVVSFYLEISRVVLFLFLSQDRYMVRNQFHSSNVRHRSQVESEIFDY